MGRYAAEVSEETARAEAQAVRQRREGSLLAILFGLAALVVVFDQLTKQWAIENLSEVRAEPFIGDLISFQLTFNPGAAFGIASGTTWIFTIIAVVVAVVVIRVSRHIGSLAWTICLGLLLGGAVGNLIDRLFREPGFPEGHVVDFINYAGQFIGNVADIAIVGAAVGIALLALFGLDVDGTRHRRPTDDGEAPADVGGAPAVDAPPPAGGAPETHDGADAPPAVESGVEDDGERGRAAPGDGSEPVVVGEDEGESGRG